MQAAPKVGQLVAEARDLGDLGEGFQVLHGASPEGACANGSSFPQFQEAGSDLDVGAHKAALGVREFAPEVFPDFVGLKELLLLVQLESSSEERVSCYMTRKFGHRI